MRILRALACVSMAVAIAGCAPQPSGRLANPPIAADPQPTGNAAQSSAPVDLGPTAQTETVRFSVSLRLPGARDLETYLAGLVNPSSPFFRKYLTPAEFGARFGLPQVSVQRVVKWLADGGLTASATPQRTSVFAEGSAAQVSTLLGIQLLDRQNPDGARYHVPIGQPSVPQALSDEVEVIVGLNSEPVQKPAFGGMYGSGVPAPGIVPSLVSRAYEIDPLRDAGLLGDGLSIAIVSFDTFTPSDIPIFEKQVGLSGAPDVRIIRLPGAVDTPGGGAGEVSLDIEVIRGIAPHAQILDYEGPNTSDGLAPVIARIVADAQAKIVSISWGTCENRNDPRAMAAEEREFAAAFAAGISIFSSSGDDAAYDCRRVDISDNPFERDITPGVDWPTASANVISVGGTFLSVRQDGTYLDEAGWEEPLGGSGGGGGVSKIQPRPSWQQGAGVDNSHSTGMRQVPDVAGPADPTSGFYVIFTDPKQGLVSGRVGGTSAAAPFWAGSMLLAQQLGQQEGVATLGPLGPVLYQVAASQAAGAVFHDIVRGGNLLYEAAPGWDYSTGLGSPRVAPLARAIIDFLKP